MKIRANFFLILLGINLVTCVSAETLRYSLNNGVVAVEFSPNLGGRLTSFSLLSKKNILNCGEANFTPSPKALSAETDAIPYLGHEVWVGPQSHWWLQQAVLPLRAEAKAVWPPDPYLTQAAYSVVEKTRKKLVLKGPQSPVSGVAFTKSYAFTEHKNQLELMVAATNNRSENVAWDIWFNTRVFADTQVYVPVKQTDDIRVSMFVDTEQNTFLPRVTDNIFTLDLRALAKEKKAGKAKLFMQPSAGWMAGFHDDQVLIFQFDWQPLANIHPEQGQIELYYQFEEHTLTQGVIEMEVHSPYCTIAPGADIKAKELWTILPYTGAATREAQLAFLREQAVTLGLKGL
jgi:hypothetical protein